MTIPKNITRAHILDAMATIDDDGVPRAFQSRVIDLLHDGKRYPPKYVIAIANWEANGEQLGPEEFRTSQAQRFLMKMGFTVVPKKKL